MKNIKIAVLSAVSLFSACGAGAQPQAQEIYKNATLDFSVSYTKSLSTEPVVWNGMNIGVEIKRPDGNILVRSTPVDKKFGPMSFDEYAGVAAQAEIDAFQQIASSEPFISDYGIKGRKTLWRPQSDPAAKPSPLQEDADMRHAANLQDPAVSAAPVTIAGRKRQTVSREDTVIYYFPLIKQKELKERVLKTAMITCRCSTNTCRELEQEALAIALSARYGASVQKVLREDDDGITVPAAVGNSFRLELKSNPTTGYMWKIKPLHPEIISVMGSGFIPPKEQMPGAGGTEWWELSADKAGKTQIELSYFRPWEGEKKSIKKYKLFFTVK